jgi:hypothetical protein
VYFTLQGPPFFVRSLKISGASIELTLSGGEKEILDPSTLRQDNEGRLFCNVRNGGFTALFTPHAMMMLWPYVSEDEQGTYLRIGHNQFRPLVVSE